MHLSPQWRRKLEKFKERFAAIFRDDKESEARPKLCPSCGTLVGATAKKCHDCGTSISFSMAAVSRSIGEAIPQESPVTYFILAANFMLFTVCLAATGQITGEFSIWGGIDTGVLSRLGARDTFLIMHGEVWRLVMPIFLHGGLLHIGMNMFGLKNLGPELEEIYGSARYLFLYVVTGVLGFMWTTIWNLWEAIRSSVPMGFPISIGASGSLMGLLGLAIAVTTIRGGSFMQMIRKQLLINLGIILMLGLTVRGIDNAAHIGGFVSGFVLGRLFEPREPMNTKERTRANVLGWFGGLIVVGSFAATVIRYFFASPTP